MNKKSVIVVALVLSVIFISTFASASVFSDLWNKITGQNVVTGHVIETGWTPWLNRDTPGGSADAERISDFISDGNPNFCASADDVTGVECRVKSTGVDASQSGEIVTCDTETGFICLNADQSDGHCLDYEVRYYCGESESSSNIKPKGTIFVTDSVWSAGNVNGVPGADAKSQSAADSANLEGTWRAVISAENSHNGNFDSVLSGLGFGDPFVFTNMIGDPLTSASGGHLGSSFFDMGGYDGEYPAINYNEFGQLILSGPGVGPDCLFWSGAAAVMGTYYPQIRTDACVGSVHSWTSSDSRRSGTVLSCSSLSQSTLTNYMRYYNIFQDGSPAPIPTSFLTGNMQCNHHLHLLCVRTDGLDYQAPPQPPVLNGQISFNESSVNINVGISSQGRDLIQISNTDNENPLIIRKLQLGYRDYRDNNQPEIISNILIDNNGEYNASLGEALFSIHEISIPPGQSATLKVTCSPQSNNNPVGTGKIYFLENVDDELSQAIARLNYTCSHEISNSPLSFDVPSININVGEDQSGSSDVEITNILDHDVGISKIILSYRDYRDNNQPEIISDISLNGYPVNVSTGMFHWFSGGPYHPFYIYDGESVTLQVTCSPQSNNNPVGTGKIYFLENVDDELSQAIARLDYSCSHGSGETNGPSVGVSGFFRNLGNGFRSLFGF